MYKLQNWFMRTGMEMNILQGGMHLPQEANLLKSIALPIVHLVFISEAKRATEVSMHVRWEDLLLIKNP